MFIAWIFFEIAHNGLLSNEQSKQNANLPTDLLLRVISWPVAAWSYNEGHKKLQKYKSSE